MKMHESSHHSRVQACLRDQLCSYGTPKQVLGQEKQHRELLTLLTRTAEGGERNNILIMGPRNSGKSTLLENVLTELKLTVDANSHFLEVRLNGLLQTDDRIALQEIARQLELENVVGDKVFGSFSETLQFLLDALKGGNIESKSILFILEEFDLFAQHHNQTLLYNLFDVSQSDQAPVCVVGVTSRLDVLDLLEKRVKSRYSHRQINMLSSFSFDDFNTVLANYLHLDAASTGLNREFCKCWNLKVKEVIQESTVQDILRNLHSHAANVGELLNLAYCAVCRVSSDDQYLTSTHFLDSAVHMFGDKKASLLNGLSVLELSLIIAMQHLRAKYHDSPFNFEMVYHEYQKFCETRSSVQTSNKMVVMKAFQYLCDLELVKLLDTNARTQVEYRIMFLNVSPSQLNEALQTYPSCPTELKVWAQHAVIA